MREARIENTNDGRLPVGDGWFILNLGEMPWETVTGSGAWRDFDWAQKPGEPGIGFHIHVLQPGENFGYYHAEAKGPGEARRLGVTVGYLTVRVRLPVSALGVAASQPLNCLSSLTTSCA
jgi:hypothetical protein